jgi:hypothetical protein
MIPIFVPCCLSAGVLGVITTPLLTPCTSGRFVCVLICLAQVKQRLEAWDDEERHDTGHPPAHCMNITLCLCVELPGTGEAASGGLGR